VLKLPLRLFGAWFPADRVRPHGHRACVHLLLNTSLLEPPSCLLFSETVPSVEELCRQLDIIEIVDDRRLRRRHRVVVAAVAPLSSAFS
jgi:hypothetical protein